MIIAEWLFLSLYGAYNIPHLWLPGIIIVTAIIIYYLVVDGKRIQIDGRDNIYQVNWWLVTLVCFAVMILSKMLCTGLLMYALRDFRM